MSLLERYTKRAEHMTLAELHYALRDVQQTLRLYRDAAPTEGYAAKLWAEFDSYVVELDRRRCERSAA